MTMQRSFRVGRQSEQLYNEELLGVYESIKYLLSDTPPTREEGHQVQHGSLWMDQESRVLYSYDHNEDKWNVLYDKELQRFNLIMEENRPSNPTHGQLWINDGMLWYFDSESWKPIHAYDPNENTAVTKHEDFIYLSPVSEKADNDLVVNGVQMKQYMVPDVNTGRLYYKNKYVSNLDHESRIALRYPVQELDSGDVSWMHINPARLTNISKHVIRIDKDTAYYDIPLYESELFGFTSGNPFGEPLMSADAYVNGDYRKHKEGIILTERAMKKYDFILVVKYDFGWTKAVGKVHVSGLAQKSIGYYMGRKGPDFNMFVEGYDMESNYFVYDPYKKSITSTEEELNYLENEDKEWEVSFLSSSLNEYGYIRRTEGDHGIIKPRHKFRQPLVLVAGQAMLEKDMEKLNRSGVVKVKNAKEGMAYCIIELDDPHNRIVHECKSIQNNEGEGVIWFGLKDLREFVKVQDGLIVFVDGALMHKEAIEVDYDNNYIKVPGLQAGQEVIVIQDKKHDLMFESLLHPAYNTPYIDESLVFFNGKLINNDSSVKSYRHPRRVKGSYHNEVKVFDLIDEDGSQQLSYKVWNEFGRNWLDCTPEEVEGINSFCFSYDNGMESIALRIDREETDDVTYWIYQFARTAERPLHIYHEFLSEEEALEMWDTSDYKDEYGNKMMFIPVDETYTYGANSLEVYFNGVRQYDQKDFTDKRIYREHQHFGIVESPKGDGFYVKGLFWGDITYVIEHPADGVEKTCEREILNQYNATSSPGVYETIKALVPGVVSVYVGGLKQSRDSFIVLDNNRIMLKNQFVPTGHGPGGLAETEFISEHETIDFDYSQEDLILIEVSRDHRKKQGTAYRSYKMSEIELAQKNLIEFDLDLNGDNLSNTVLTTTDEIKIYANGLFTGYRRNEGYKINELSNTVVVTARNLSDHIFVDELYETLMGDNKLMQRYLKENNLTEEDLDKRSVTNAFVLEWR